MATVPPPSSRIGDGSLTAAGDEPGVFRQHAARVARRRRFPLRLPRRQLRVGDVDAQLASPRARVDRDRVALTHQGEWPAERRFRRHVSHDEPMCSAGEPPIRDEPDTATEPGADARRRRVQDLAHARPALDRKSTRLNSSHPSISYAVFCLKKKNIIYKNIYKFINTIK